MTKPRFAPSEPLRFCFLMERQVGIGSAAAAIEPYVRARGHAWCDVTYEDDGLIERLPLPERPRGTLRGYVQVSSQLLKERYDGLFFLTHNPAVFHPASLALTPTVLWTDVTPAQLDQQAHVYNHPVHARRLITQLTGAAVRATFRLARACVAWSSWARESFVNDYAVERTKTAVVPPGVDLQRWKLPAERRNEGLPRLLFVGGNFERKGGLALLEVFRTGLRGRCELDIVTRDPVPEELGVRVHRGLNATSPELLALYQNASVFVLPTRGDCFSIASLEAMAMGLPVVVSNVGGIGDIIEHERSGYLVDVDDGETLKRSLDALISRPMHRQELGARGRAVVEERFDAERSAARLIGLLEEVAR